MTIKKTIITMKQEIVMKFGEESFEAGYAQYVFSKRSTETFVSVYEQLMKQDSEDE